MFGRGHIVDAFDQSEIDEADAFSRCFAGGRQHEVVGFDVDEDESGGVHGLDAVEQGDGHVSERDLGDG